MFVITGESILASAQAAARNQPRPAGRLRTSENERIAVREYRGRVEFRAYPHGLAHPDGGAGPWLDTFERAEKMLEQADAEIARDAELAAAREAVAGERPKVYVPLGALCDASDEERAKHLDSVKAASAWARAQTTSPAAVGGDEILQRVADDVDRAAPMTEAEIVAHFAKQGHHQPTAAPAPTRRPPTTTCTSRAIAGRIGRYVAEYDPTAKVPTTAQFLRLEVRSDGYANAHVEGEHESNGLCSFPTAQECGERGAAAEFVECGA